QLPSNAHAYRLYVFKDPRKTSTSLLRFALPAVISEAFDYDMLLNNLSNQQDFHPTAQFALPLQINPLCGSIQLAARFELSLEL
ncbi:hypothetical protein QTI66_33900, partial [Variovorax sp. J22R133]|uniref:hypothetical protein n=1 Tax=Variovorax brevis TaxID=3053503 RepID=UPI0025751604